MEISTKSAKETKKFGKKIANNLKGGEILALVGDLGSGKTTFVKGLAKGLGINQRIVSPTFIIMRKYDIKLQNSKTPKLQDLYHIDLYRLETNIEREMKNFGTDEIFSDSENIVVIEWAEKGKNAIPKEAIWIKFENLGGNKRKIRIIK